MSRKNHVIFRTIISLMFFVVAMMITTISAKAAATISKPENNKEYEFGNTVSIEASAMWEKPEGGSNSDPNTITFRIEGNDSVLYVKKQIKKPSLNIFPQQAKAEFIPDKEGEYTIMVRHDKGDVDWEQTVSEENPFVPDSNQIRTIKIWKNFTKADVNVTGISDKEYTGQPIVQEPVVTVDGKQLVKDQDYTVSYSDNNTVPGEVTVTITGKGFYKNSVTRTFQITPATITPNCVSGVVDLPFSRAAIRDRQNPVVVVNGKTLVRDTDYKVQFENHNSAGLATLIILGQGYYTGEVRVPFQIIPGSIADATISGLKDMAYTGSPVVLRSLSLQYKNYGIYENTDYTVTYLNNVGPGTATVIITGKTNFTGSVTRTFNIIEPEQYDSSNSCYLMAPRDNSEYKPGTKIIIKASTRLYQYEQGGVQVPNYIYLRVIKDGQTVEYAKFPYTSTSDIIEVEYTPPVNGIYQIQACRYSSYTLQGTSLIFNPLEESNFKAMDSRTIYVGVTSPTGPKDISTATISGVTYMKYTGNSITQSPTVNLDGKTLANNIDYYLTYTNNVEVGTATMTIRGKGNYTGKISKTFSIFDRKDYAIQSLADQINFLESEGISQYPSTDRTAIQNAIDAAKGMLQNVDTAAETFENALTTLNNLVTTAQKHLVDQQKAQQQEAAKKKQQMEAAKKADAALPSAKTVEKRILRLKTDSDPAGSAFAPLELKSTKQTKSSVTLKWKAVSGASAYVIYGSKCGNSNRIKKIATVKKTSFIQKKLKKGTYYKYIVVAQKSTTGGIKAATISKMIHVATKSGKVGNIKTIIVKIRKSGKWKKTGKITVKKSKSIKLKVIQTPVSKKLKVKKHTGLRYESSDPKIATVNSKGAIKGKAKGTCYVFVYAQNGVSKKIKVTVK